MNWLFRICMAIISLVTLLWLGIVGGVLISALLGPTNLETWGIIAYGLAGCYVGGTVGAVLGICVALMILFPLPDDEAAEPRRR